VVRLTDPSTFFHYETDGKDYKEVHKPKKKKPKQEKKPEKSPQSISQVTLLPHVIESQFRKTVKNDRNFRNYYHKIILGIQSGSTISEIAEDCGLKTSSLYYWLTRLENEFYMIEKIGYGRYALTPLGQRIWQSIRRSGESSLRKPEPVEMHSLTFSYPILEGATFDLTKKSFGLRNAHKSFENLGGISVEKSGHKDGTANFQIHLKDIAEKDYANAVKRGTIYSQRIASIYEKRYDMKLARIPKINREVHSVPLMPEPMRKEIMKFVTPSSRPLRGDKTPVPNTIELLGNSKGIADMVDFWAYFPVNFMNFMNYIQQTNNLFAGTLAELSTQFQQLFDMMTPPEQPDDGPRRYLG
jgi:hypothetical protein